MASRTLAFLKPDTACNPIVVQRVLQVLEESRLKVAHSKQCMWTKETAEAFYLAHKHRFFYNRLCGMLSSGPFLAIVLESADGDDAVAKWRKLIGPTHALKAKLSDPACLRAQFATSDTRNGFHGADEESVEQELQFVFPEIYRSKSSM